MCILKSEEVEGTSRVVANMSDGYLLENLHIHVLLELARVEQPVMKALVHAGCYTLVICARCVAAISYSRVQLLGHEEGLKEKREILLKRSSEIVNQISELT